MVGHGKDHVGTRDSSLRWQLPRYNAGIFLKRRDYADSVCISCVHVVVFLFVVVYWWRRWLFLLEQFFAIERTSRV